MPPDAAERGAISADAYLNDNPWLLKRHIADVFPAVPEIFGPRAVFSAELGRSKADPEAYRLLAGRLQVAPDEILFFDDGGRQVLGAREAGLTAYRFGSAAGVRAALAGPRSHVITRVVGTGWPTSSVAGGDPRCVSPRPS